MNSKEVYITGEMNLFNNKVAVVTGGMTKLMIYHNDFGWTYNDNELTSISTAEKVLTIRTNTTNKAASMFLFHKLGCILSFNFAHSSNIDNIFILAINTKQLIKGLLNIRCNCTSTEPNALTGQIQILAYMPNVQQH